jgi:hypothetical protein
MKEVEIEHLDHDTDEIEPFVEADDDDAEQNNLEN